MPPRPIEAAQLAERVEALLRPSFGPRVRVGGLTQIAGGSSCETWAFEVGERRLVLRRDPRGLGRSGVSLEGELLVAARLNGVRVPELVLAGDHDSGLDAPFVITEFVEGETIPRRILRDEQYDNARKVLTSQCAESLARIHAIPLSEVPHLAPVDILDQLRSLYDQLGQPHPAFELAFRRLNDRRPESGAKCVVHGDFRNGNLMVGPEGLRAVLDWELAHLGDPLEDLGWLCVKAWRFGSELPVGGFGELQELIYAYEGFTARSVDRDALAWWVMAGTLKWGILCSVQAMMHVSGAVRSIDLATTGRRVCETEWDLLELMADDAGVKRDDGSAPSDLTEESGTVPPEIEVSTAPSPPYDLPSAAELLQAVREFLSEDVVSATSGRQRFNARVAANALGIVSRELALSELHRQRHAERLAELGMRNEYELARAIRDGELDSRLDEVLATVRATVADKLAVANPGYS